MEIYKVKVGASYGWVGSHVEDEIEFEMPDNATMEQVEEEAQKIAWEWACERVDCYAETPAKQTIPEPKTEEDGKNSDHNRL